MATGHELGEQGILHDKLRDQISVSIKDSLSKATAVLSSLHRVHSYLEVLKSIPSLTSGGEGVKGALEQVRAIRTDAAALLQTIYLTEIGLQSLEQVDKSTSSSAGDVTIISNTVNPPPSDLPGDVITNTAINSSNRDEVMQGGAVVELPEISDTIHPTSSAPASEDSAPPAKKQNFGIVITKCVSCKRKYATDQIDPQSEGKCKVCRSQCTPSNHTGAPTNQTPIKNLLLTPEPVLSSTPNTASPGGPKSKVRKVTTTPMACKVCGTSFVYRRCLFRHLRENHPGIDLNNIHDYIEAETVNEGGSLPDEGTGSQNTSMNVTVGSEVPPVPSDIDESEILPQNPMAHEDELLPVEEGEGVQGDLETSMKQTYTCTICSKTFDRPYRLTRHLNIHDPNRPRVLCHICDRSFTRFDTLENHVKSVHSDERPFQCQYSTCKKMYATQTALMNHLKVHTNGKPYQCQECDAAFSLLIEYKMHARQKHADTERLRCNDCYKVFPDVGSLENHRSAEHLFECEVCGKKFARLAYLQLHIKVHNGEKVYNCGVCSQGFDSEIAYRQHMRSHPKPTRGKRFHCQLCDKSFEAPNELIAHYRCEEHREKASALGLGENTTLLNTIEGGDLSDMSALVDEVAMGTTSIAMETTPVTMTTTMDPKQVSMDVTPVVLSAIEDQAASNIISSAIAAQSASFQT